MDPLNILMIVLFVILLFGNVPIAFIFGIIGIIGLFGVGFDGIIAVRSLYFGMESFALMAIPFFAFAGNIMTKGGITDQLVEFSESLVGWVRGSLGHVNVVASILFAGISGAAVSDAAALGSMLIPAMEKEGYSRSYSGALTAASSMIGPVIPPSIPIVVYGGTMDMSIGTLFAAGIVPGIMLGIIQMFINYYIVVKRGYDIKERKPLFDSGVNLALGKRFIEYLKNILSSAKAGILALIMFLIIFGGILGGVFTATEAAAVAAFYAIIVTLFVLRSIDLKETWEVLLESAAMTGYIMLIIGGGTIISRYLVVERIPDLIATYMTGMTETPWVFMLIVAVFLIFIGTFMSLLPSIIILAPVLTPVAIEYGINPYHFGFFFVFCLNTALITPPIGGVLFVVTGVGKIKFEALVKEILPFYIAFIAIILLVLFYEPMTTFLPKFLGLL